MTNHSRSRSISSRSAVVVLATLTAFGGGIAFAAGTGATTSSYSARTLVSEAEADLAAGHPGRAILRYERAELAAPRSPAVSAGLARARAAANLPPIRQSMAVRALRMASADVWAWVGMSGLIVLAMAVVALAWGLVRKRGFLALAAAGGVAALGLVAARGVSTPIDRAIVVGTDVVARIAPFTTADEAFAAREGSEVSVVSRHGGYTLISTPEGRAWVLNEAVETILPRATHSS